MQLYLRIYFYLDCLNYILLFDGITFYLFLKTLFLCLKIGLDGIYLNDFKYLLHRLKHYFNLPVSILANY